VCDDLDTCAEAGDVSAGGSWTNFVNTSTLSDNYNDSNPSCITGQGSNEAVFVMTLTSSKTVTISTVGSSFDTILYVSTSCPGSSGSVYSVACDDDSGGGLSSRISQTFAAGTYYIFVDGYSAGYAGLISLSVTIN